MDNKKQRIIIISLSIISMAAIGVTIWALFFRDTKPKVNLDYAPQQIESNAEKADDDDKTKLEQPEGGGAVSLTYSNKVTLSLQSKQANLLFQNPSKSNQNMMLEIVIDHKTIVKSGRIDPGYKIEKLDGVDMNKLSKGSYEGKFVISYYEAKSGEKAMINTEIPITITVEE